MGNKNKLSRRDFLKIATIGAGAITIGAGGMSFIEGCSTTQQAGRNFFSADEYRLMESIAEQIIPTDEWPGGREAGVANFIDIQLIGPYKRFQKDYRKGLAAIETTCSNRYNKKFEELSWNTQTDLLKDMESGKLSGEAWEDGFSRKFFELLRSHSLQGYYGSPRHGGNKDFISYKMMGLDEVQTVGENRHGV